MSKHVKVSGLAPHWKQSSQAMSSFKGRLFQPVALFLCLTVVLGLAVAASGQSAYHLLHTYKLGAAPGATREYFDYITVDSGARRVYLSHGTEIRIIDADKGSDLGNIAGLKQSHGVALALSSDAGSSLTGAPPKSLFLISKR